MEKPDGDDDRYRRWRLVAKAKSAFQFEFRHSSLKTGLQLIGSLAGLSRVDLGVGLASQFLVLELVGPMSRACVLPAIPATR